MDEQNAKTYRMRFKPIFRLIALGSVLLCLPASLIVSLTVTGFDIRLIGLLTVGTVIFVLVHSLISTPILILLHPTKISESGIKGGNFWGLGRRFVEWESMEKCGTANFLGLKYLKVFTLDKKFPLWIPLFLNHMQDFREEIITLADQGNCLRSYFETEKEQE